VVAPGGGGGDGTTLLIVASLGGGDVDVGCTTGMVWIAADQKVCLRCRHERC
jgi:hypothetical protein